MSFLSQRVVTMGSLLSAKPMKVGDRALEAFNRAGYQTVGDLFNFDSGEIAGERRMMEAIIDMKKEDADRGRALLERDYRSLGTRCANIVNTVRNATASPYAPDYLICQISKSIMDDPVLTPSGYSYERAAVEKWIAEKGEDPFAKIPLTVDQLYPNKPLREATLYYRNKLQTYVIPPLSD